MVKKAITHLKLDWANKSKLQQLDELIVEHQRVTQAYCDWLISRQMRQPDKYADIPEAEVPTALSDRWQRCACEVTVPFSRSKPAASSSPGTPTNALTHLF